MTITRNQRNSDEQNEILPPSTKSSIKATCLKTAQAIFSKDLIETEIRFWWDFLDSYKDQEVSYAFENWNRNGKFFPKPGDIRELIEAYRDSTRQSYNPSLYAGNGFGKVEVLSLWAMVDERMADFKKRGETYIPLTDDEITELCRQIEAKKRAA